MSANINGLEGLGNISKAVSESKNATGQAVDGAGFKDFLLNNLEKVNQMQNEAEIAVEGLVTGREADITKVMGAVEKADVAFQTLMSVRGKLVDSYNEVMQMRL